MNYILCTTREVNNENQSVIASISNAVRSTSSEMATFLSIACQKINDLNLEDWDIGDIITTSLTTAESPKTNNQGNTCDVILSLKKTSESGDRARYVNVQLKDLNYNSNFINQIKTKLIYLYEIDMTDGEYMVISAHIIF